MKVIATARGYYGDQLREVGEVFTLMPRVKTDRRGKFVENLSVEDQFSHEWMERADGKVAPPKKINMPEDVLPPPPPPSALKQPSSMPAGAKLGNVPQEVVSNEPTGGQDVI